MKKLLAGLLALAALTGCAASKTPSSPPAVSAPTVRVAALKGPTAMGMAGLSDNESLSLSVVPSVDALLPLLSKGETDVAALPANLAAVLHQKTEGEIVVLGINTLGVLYLAEAGDTVHTVADLKGKTILSAGKGATPEYALRYLLTANGIDPDREVTLEWKSEHSEVLAALLADPSAIGMLPQPFLTTAQQKNADLRVALDLNAGWESAQTNPTSLLTGVVVTRRAFLDEHPEEVKAFLTAYADSVRFVNEHPAEAAPIIEQLGIVPAAVAETAIPACGITLITGEAMQQKLSAYLTVLWEQNPKAVGGSLPQDDFYVVFS